jgi:DNA-binding XRE family transcriptional regulator
VNQRNWTDGTEGKGPFSQGKPITLNWRQVQMGKNVLREIRESFLMSKAELARKAGVSPVTLDRIEKGKNCRLETKRKILLALGYKLAEKEKVFPE